VQSVSHRENFFICYHIAQLCKVRTELECNICRKEETTASVIT
jgi:hypothetical protein